ncbi:MAG: TonB-dependent receptor plug domain-containing protein, partial [Pseudomonadales bacterium]|nr:TonB-dependent receptor plug domain-containing protein [Pseudomonadales bacterium]
MRNFSFTIFAALLCAVPGVPAIAAPVLEEIVVTATKRPESLQDVSVAVSVMAGEQLDQQAITTLEELTYYVPSVQISEAAVSTNIFIRGVGSGVNYGFEQSVGTFIDGVYYGRSRSARNPFLDVERVEVLKGLQGVLFGKNTIAGALNITTRAPTTEWENSVAAYWEPEFDTREITGVLSGPLSDDF